MTSLQNENSGLEVGRQQHVRGAEKKKVHKKNEGEMSREQLGELARVASQSQGNSFKK